MQLKLIVLRTGEMELLKDFYTVLGLTFQYHSHDNSPYHYSATVNNSLLEIYPLAKGQAEADKHLRLGFAIDNFETVIQLLAENVIVAPQASEFGYFAIVKDTDGRKVEIYKN